MPSLIQPEATPQIETMSIINTPENAGENGSSRKIAPERSETESSGESNACSVISSDKPEKHKEEKAAEKDPALANATVGSISSIKPIYQGPEDSQGRAQWVDKYPDDVEEAAENDETDKYALIARKCKNFDGRKKFNIHSIIVHSPDLKKILGEQVLTGYPGVTCELDRLIFDSPFEPFVHRWAEFLEAINKAEGRAKDHMQLLHGILKEELQDTIKALEDFILHGVTTFNHVWTIFQPGSVIYTNSGGAQKALKLSHAYYQKLECGVAYSLSMEPILWSGSGWGRGVETVNIFKFTGTKAIQDLKAFPLAFHPKKEEITRTLVERGEKYESLAGYHFKAYDGVALSWNSKGQVIPVNVTGRIIIDTEAFNTANPDESEALDALQEDDFTASEVPDVAGNSNYETESTSTNLKLTSKAHLICKSTLRGYSLKLKKWLYFFVDFVHEIVFNTDAFSNLVLPPSTKDLLHSFVETQVASSNSLSQFDDVIAGKGRGIIMLLSGPPGVGKTLTAESVAESMSIPLFTMSAGDLGIDPGDVEVKLRDILEMVAKWKAILLLDECDVFLEERTTSDLERNKLVSIFLRTLEYYEGILFLTTNRVDNMDTAFQSRIHVQMEYPDLTSESRMQIWSNFLKDRDTVVTVDDVSALAKVKLNGRQIKNVLKTALLLSARRGSPLKREDIETILAIGGRAI